MKVDIDMKKFFLFLLVLTSASLFSPKSILAADQTTNSHWLMAKPGPKASEVILTWRHAEDANNYHLVYGTEHGKFKYGATNIGWINSFTVRGLVPGREYHFALVPVKNDVALYTTVQVMANAASGQVMEAKPSPVVAQPKAAAPTTVTVAGNKHWLTAKPGPKGGEITLSWRHAEDANNYHLVYGTEHSKFKYGAINIGWINSFTVRGLVPGKLYHFALVPVKNDVALYTSEQVMVVAAGGVEVVQTTKEALRQPKPVVQPKQKVPVPQKGNQIPQLQISPATQATSTPEPTTPAGL